MNVLPPPSLNPLQYQGPPSDIERIARVPQQGELWHIKVENRSPPVSRESQSKVTQLENSIQFINRQHNEVLKSLYAEIESLKLKNRGM